MKKLLLAIPAVLLLATSCSLSDYTGKNDHACADKFMQQQTQSAPVKGTFACLNHDTQQLMKARAVSDDAKLALSIGPDATDKGQYSYRYVERSKDGGYLYELELIRDGKITIDGYALVYEDKDGKIKGLKYLLHDNT